MALALARSAATRVGYDPGRALAAYLEWFRTSPPDVGQTIRAALAGVEAGLSDRGGHRGVSPHDGKKRRQREPDAGGADRVAPPR